MAISVDFRKRFESFSLSACFDADDEVVGLLGASGCGKSMTLKCIAGIVRPDEGYIALNGRVLYDSKRGINLPPQKRGVGLLFQNYALFPNMTVEQNIKSVLSTSKRGDLRARFSSLVERFYIAGLDRHYPAQLSGGQQQRVALARIMASEPAIMMLDEPLSALDSYLRWQVEGELADVLESYAGTTLYVSHSRDEVYRLCKRVCVMNDGRTEEMRTTQELFESPNTFASSILSGCKNYSRASRIDDATIYAQDWNLRLTSHTAVPDDLRYVGIRAHYVAPTDETDGENVVRCRVLRVTPDVFSTIVNLRPLAANSDHDFSKIRMELPKEEASNIHAGNTISVLLAPDNLMLLKE